MARRGAIVMTKSWKRAGALLMSACLAAAASGCAAQSAPPAPTVTPAASTAPAVEKKSGVGFYFDTVVTLTLYGAPEGLLDELWADCTRYEQLLSKTIEGSDVDRINHAEGKPVAVSPETYEILRRAREISDATGHAFSVTIAPITAMWDFTGGTKRMPTDEERLAALPLVDDARITLNEDGTVTLPAGMEIDLGGIAKGYIADRIAEKVAPLVTGAVLSFGGNIYCVGEKPDGGAFRVGVQDPDGQSGALLAVVSVGDATVVTSGIYERCFEKDGVTYHHILDPKDGLPARSDLSSATIVAQSSMTADALATACIVLGREKALALLKEMGYDGLLVTRDRQVFVTDGFAQRYGLQMQEDVPVH